MFGKRLCLSDQQMGFSVLCNVIDVTSTMQTEMFIPILGVLAGNTCMKVCIYPKVMGSSVQSRHIVHDAYFNLQPLS